TDHGHPLLERVKFAAIVASNLDEFFMVRVAALKHLEQDGERTPGPCGLTPAEQLDAIAAGAHEMVAALYRCVMTDLLPALRAEGIALVGVADLGARARAGVGAYFHDEI